MRHILGIAITLTLLLIPAKLSFIKLNYKPTYPACIMQVGDVKYLLLEPGGEVIRSETQNCKKIFGKK